MAEYHTTAVAFGDLKNAALYFDHLIPVFLAAELVGDQAEWNSLLSGGARELIPPALLDRPGFGERLREVNQATFLVLCKLGIQRFGLRPQIGGVSEEQYAGIEEAAGFDYFSFIDEYDLREYPLVSAGGPASAWMADDESSSPSPVVTLADLKLIDASSVPWQQVFEFRRDHRAREKLRRLRLFAYQNWTGRPRAYIEDDLLTRLSEYEETARQWGLETVQGAASVVLNSKLTASLVAGSFLSTLFGQPVTALLSAAVGAVVELGHVAVELSRQRFALSKLMRDNPVSFVSYSRTKLRR